MRTQANQSGLSGRKRRLLTIREILTRHWNVLTMDNDLRKHTSNHPLMSLKWLTVYVIDSYIATILHLLDKRSG